MADFVVIVPSRGRPEAVLPLVAAFANTTTADTALMFVIDNSDPELPAYRGAIEIAQDGATPLGYGTGASTTMVEALNGAGHMLVVDEHTKKPPFAIGFMGDDHRPRTVGWDERYLDALRELGTGMVYGDDLLQGANLPTQIAMTSDIVRALGYMAPPDLVHMYVDNWWLQLGTQADCIRYLPDVVVEHIHPIAGKADWDEGHQRVNAPEMYRRDQTTFARLRVLELPGAVAKVRALRGGS